MNNEQRFAMEVRQALDDSASALPYKVTHRLQAARKAALARMPEARAESRAQAASVTVVSGGRSAAIAGVPEPSLWARAAMLVLPLVVVAAGLVAISVWNDTINADETVDIDTAMLTDDVPISAYADRGFGVYLKNANQ